VEQKRSIVAARLNMSYQIIKWGYSSKISRENTKQI